MTLSQLGAQLEEDEIVSIEASVLAKEVAATRARFRKRPDEPLGEVIKPKLTGENPTFNRKRK